HAKMFLTDGKTFDLITRYQQRLNKAAAQFWKQLQELQAERFRREQAEMPDAVLIYKNFRAAGGTFDPQSIGFVLTIPQIEAYRNRENLRNPGYVLEEVKKARTKVA